MPKNDARNYLSKLLRLTDKILDLVTSIFPKIFRSQIFLAPIPVLAPCPAKFDPAN
jgi:hypothetical protein